jgi:hypothetical protein
LKKAAAEIDWAAGFLNGSAGTYNLLRRLSLSHG